MEIRQYGLIDRNESTFPSDIYRIHSHRHDDWIYGGGTWYGGATEDILINGTYTVSKNTLFSFSGDEIHITCDKQCDITVISRTGYKGQCILGVLFEDGGRKIDSDGTTSTTMIYPATPIDPYLNHVHVPYDVTFNSPASASFRLGYVARGYGQVQYDGISYAVKAGDIFCIDAGDNFAVKTDQTSDLDVLLYHPSYAIFP